MIKFLVILFLVCCLIFIVYFLHFERKCNSKSIYNLAINDEFTHQVKALKKIIRTRLQDDLLLIVIKDNISFLDSNYYWPKRSVYVHHSDMNIFLEKHALNKSCSREEIDSFIKDCVLIY